MYISKSTACQDSLPFRLRKNGGVEVITAANSVRVDPTDPDARQSDSLSEVYEIRDTCDTHMIHDSVTHKYLCVILISDFPVAVFSLMFFRKLDCGACHG